MRIRKSNEKCVIIDEKIKEHSSWRYKKYWSIDVEVEYKDIKSKIELPVGYESKKKAYNEMNKISNGSNINCSVAPCFWKMYNKCIYKEGTSFTFYFVGSIVLVLITSIFTTLFAFLSVPLIEERFPRKSNYEMVCLNDINVNF